MDCPAIKIDGIDSFFPLFLHTLMLISCNEIISFLIHLQLAPKLDPPMYNKFQFHNLFANEIFTYEHIQPKIRCLSKDLKYVLHAAPTLNSYRMQFASPRNVQSNFDSINLIYSE